MGTRSERERIEGGLFGLLVGDALGVPYEFHSPESVPPPAEIELSPPSHFPAAHRVPAGTWSDDGAQALCLLASLLDRNGLDLEDFSRRLLEWLDRGTFAVDGHVFDCGVQTRVGLAAIRSGVPAKSAGPAGEWDNGNGSLMRVLPLALWHRGSDDELALLAERQSLPTHGHLRARLCCALYCLWARGLLSGLDEDQAWVRAVETMRRISADDEARITELETHVDVEREPGGGGSGYVVDCLHSARAALRAGTFEDVVRAAISLGNDTDTTAAVAGGIAGIRDGAASLPARWVHGLRGRDLVDPLLDRLLRVVDSEP